MCRCGPSGASKLFDIDWLKPKAQIYDVGTYQEGAALPYDGKGLMSRALGGAARCETVILDSYDGCVPESPDLAFIKNNSDQFRSRCVELGQLVNADGTPNTDAAAQVNTGDVVWYRVGTAALCIKASKARKLITATSQSAGVAAMDNTICQRIYQEAQARGMGQMIDDY